MIFFLAFQHEMTKKIISWHIPHQESQLNIFCICVFLCLGQTILSRSILDIEMLSCAILLNAQKNLPVLDAIQRDSFD